MQFYETLTPRFCFPPVEEHNAIIQPDFLAQFALASSLTLTSNLQATQALISLPDLFQSTRAIYAIRVIDSDKERYQLAGLLAQIADTSLLTKTWIRYRDGC